MDFELDLRKKITTSNDNIDMSAVTPYTMVIDSGFFKISFVKRGSQVKSIAPPPTQLPKKCK